MTTVANLFELYAYDFSDFRDLELGDDGRFGDIELPLYWSEPDRHAFLFKVRQKRQALRW
jgi:predicted acetyltransferase